MSRIVRREHFKPRRPPRLSERMGTVLDFLGGVALGVAAFVILGFILCPACMVPGP